MSDGHQSQESGEASDYRKSVKIVRVFETGNNPLMSIMSSSSIRLSLAFDVFKLFYNFIKHSKLIIIQMILVLENVYLVDAMDCILYMVTFHKDKLI